MSERCSKATNLDPLTVAHGVYDNEKCELILEDCLRRLLNEKSLYQSISASDELISQVCFDHLLSRYSEITRTHALKYLKTWLASTESYIYNNAYSAGRTYYQIQLPKTVKTYCELCKCVTTHNPVNSGDCHRHKGGSFYVHVFHAEYECQDCKSARVAFMVMRKGLNLQIMGRFPIEVASMTKEMKSQLTDDECKLFGDALMANKTGSELASVCLLRVALERYLRRVTGNLKAEKMVSGDELYEQYKKRLPDDFCYSRVVPLGKIYNDLSAVMHSAEVPDGCFERSYASIELFFRFLSLMPLQN